MEKETVIKIIQDIFAYCKLNDITMELGHDKYPLDSFNPDQVYSGINPDGEACIIFNYEYTYPLVMLESLPYDIDELAEEISDTFNFCRDFNAEISKLVRSNDLDR